MSRSLNHLTKRRERRSSQRNGIEDRATQPLPLSGFPNNLTRLTPPSG
jgi:hypothetical protein